MAKPSAEVQAINEKHDISPKTVRRLLDRYRIEDGRKFRLKDHDPGNTGGGSYRISKDAIAAAAFAASEHPG